MIHTARIKKTLVFLDAEYNRYLTDADVQKSVLYSKMALLEYSGWLELCFDDVARNCVRNRLRTTKSRKFLEEKIKITYGFTYKEKVRPLLIYGLGVSQLIAVEKKLAKDGSLETLSSNLARLNKMRQEAAHTFTSRSTQNFPAPSVTISDLEQIEPIIQKLWRLVCQ